MMEIRGVGGGNLDTTLAVCATGIRNQRNWVLDLKVFEETLLFRFINVGELRRRGGLPACITQS